MNIDITEIAVAIIGLMSAIVTSVIVPLVKAKTNANQQIIIGTIARTAVLAAQQLYGTEEGQRKKEYAARYVGQLMKQYNVTASADEISAAIEAALKELKTLAPADVW